MLDARELAICTIHGTSGHYAGEYARKYAWPRLQMEQLRRTTPPGYTVYAYGNRTLPEHRDYLRGCAEVRYIDADDVRHGHYAHVWPIRNWLTLQAVKTHRYILHLDSDAFPVAGDWFFRYAGALTEACPVVAASLREIGFQGADRLFVLFTREAFAVHHFDFTPIGVDDPGGAISERLERAGLGWMPLVRSNAVNYHRTMAGLYDGRIYHQGAGSRLPKWMDTSRRFGVDRAFQARERLVQQVLMNQVFFHTETFMRQLRGEDPPLDMERECRAAAEGSGP